ncbi:MAG: glycosyltransferase family 39 protein [Bacteroidetes bacterium]|nr:glycosyltransferase family 39 protein [Bacteroidota bacterium]
MKSVLQYNILIAVAAMLLFVPFLGTVHLFDWDEINFAECAREMLLTQDYFSVKINYQPFWEKPPLFIWMQALSMKIFGINEFAARFPNAICGIITLLILFNIGRKLVDEKFGLIWTLSYAASFLPHFYFKSGIIDPWFNLFIFSGIYYFILFSNNKSMGYLLFSAVLIGLGVLTKGPVAVLIFSLCLSVFWMFKRFEPIITLKQLLIYAITVAFIGGLWFVILIVTGHTAIIKEFFVYQLRLLNTQDAGHGGPFLYHWIVLLIGCFPMSVFALRGFKKSTFDTPYQKHFKLWMLILFWVVLILFSLVRTKIVHYSSLCYFPLSFLATYAIFKLWAGEIVWKKYGGVLLMLIAGLIGIAISVLPVIDQYKQQIIASDIIKDKFTLENLKANVHWSGFEWIIGLLLIIGVGGMPIFIRRQKIKTGIIGILIISLLTVNVTLITLVPHIEQYSQGAAIEFYEYLQDKDCYVETIGFKSYAHLFYSHKKEPQNKNSYNIDWLLKGNIEKPAYFVSKITSLEEIKNIHPSLKEIYRKNGFVFWMRLP